MHRIEGENVDTSTGVNLFRDTPPYTIQTPAWCNAVQEELVNIIEQNGIEVLSENSDTLYRNQVWTAIKSYIDSKVTWEPPDNRGWIQNSDTWTYVSADAPSYTFNWDGDVTAFVYLGQKVLYYQDSTWKYGIITAIGVYAAGATPITIYGGGNTSSPSYAMTASVIETHYYAEVHIPLDFPKNPDTWSYEVVDDTARTQGAPTDGIWYNPAGTSINVPIGIWKIQYKVHIYGHHNNPGDDIAGAKVTLSIANNSESDKDFTGYVLYDASGIPTNVNSIGGMVSINGIIEIASKTTYYLNALAMSSGFDTIGFLNNQARLVIKAVCKYV